MGVALEYLLRCLPRLPQWIVAYEPGYHDRIVQRLADRLEILAAIRLGVDAPRSVAALGRRHAKDRSCGFLELAVCDGEVTHRGIDYRRALLSFAGWPPARVRLLFDVTDANFDALFAEDPAIVAGNCARLREVLREHDDLELIGPGATRLVLRSRRSWALYTGLGATDYMLPGGEVACRPGRVDGVVEVDGWIVGTLPFGMKFGRITRSQLALRFERGAVTRVEGNHRALCRDVEMVLSRVTGLDRVAELGVGQSRAVQRLARSHKAGCLWHERHYGVHIGLGATLTTREEVRSVGHHLDVILSRGRLRGGGADILRW